MSVKVSEVTRPHDEPRGIGGEIPSGIAVPVVVTADQCGEREQSAPGEFPFTRGVFADGFRGRPWTMRQYSGFGTAEESNARYRFLFAQGQTGLSVALDLPTQIGLDPDDSMARPEIGKVGVSLSNLSEMELLFKDIDLGRVSTSFTINGTAAIIYAMYLACADKMGVPRNKLTGTIDRRAGSRHGGARRRRGAAEGHGRSRCGARRGDHRLARTAAVAHQAAAADRLPRGAAARADRQAAQAQAA